MIYKYNEMPTGSTSKTYFRKIWFGKWRLKEFDFTLLRWVNFEWIICDLNEINWFNSKIRNKNLWKKRNEIFLILQHLPCIKNIRSVDLWAERRFRSVDFKHESTWFSLDLFLSLSPPRFYNISTISTHF